jgi:hypothetical protein
MSVRDVQNYLAVFHGRCLLLCTGQRRMEPLISDLTLFGKGRRLTGNPAHLSVSQFPNELFHSRASTPLAIAVVNTSERDLRSTQTGLF